MLFNRMISFILHAHILSSSLVIEISSGDSTGASNSGLLKQTKYTLKSGTNTVPSEIL